MTRETQFDIPGYIDRMEIEDVVQTERLARDVMQWDRMSDCFWPDSVVELSWFRGTGQEFANASAKMHAGGTQTFHQMTPTVIRVDDKRALAETGGAVHLRATLAGAEADVISYTRFFTRVEKREGRWLISGLRAFYLKDMLIPSDPVNPPRLDVARMGQYRQSYRYLSYLMSERGHEIRATLPGMDLPETVHSLTEGEERWLEGI
jgi:hypothetical protein